MLVAALADLKFVGFGHRCGVGGFEIWRL